MFLAASLFLPFVIQNTFGTLRRWSAQPVVSRVQIGPLKVFYFDENSELRETYLPASFPPAPPNGEAESSEGETDGETPPVPRSRTGASFLSSSSSSSCETPQAVPLASLPPEEQAEKVKAWIQDAVGRAGRYVQGLGPSDLSFRWRSSSDPFSSFPLESEEVEGLQVLYSIFLSSEGCIASVISPSPRDQVLGSSQFSGGEGRDGGVGPGNYVYKSSFSMFHPHSIAYQYPLTALMQAFRQMSDSPLVQSLKENSHLVKSFEISVLKCNLHLVMSSVCLFGTGVSEPPVLNWEPRTLKSFIFPVAARSAERTKKRIHFKELFVNGRYPKYLRFSSSSWLPAAEVFAGLGPFLSSYVLGGVVPPEMEGLRAQGALQPAAALPWLFTQASSFRFVSDFLVVLLPGNVAYVFHKGNPQQTRGGPESIKAPRDLGVVNQEAEIFVLVSSSSYKTFSRFFPRNLHVLISSDGPEAEARAPYSVSVDFFRGTWQ